MSHVLHSTLIIERMTRVARQMRDEEVINDAVDA